MVLIHNIRLKLWHPYQSFFLKNLKICMFSEISLSFPKNLLSKISNTVLNRFACFSKTCTTFCIKTLILQLDDCSYEWA